MATDPRVDRYIAGAPAFAQPILEHVRELIHKACPDVAESVKWGRPAFLARGKISVVMSAFKAHCSIGFWLPQMNEILAKDGIEASDPAGSLGRITKLADLPPQQKLQKYFREACRLAVEEPSERAKQKRAPSPKPEAKMPADFRAAIAKSNSAAKNFAALSPGYRREYMEWIAEAKRDETRQKRIATAIEWIAEGKPRNWKYMNC